MVEDWYSNETIGKVSRINFIKVDEKQIILQQLTEHTFFYDNQKGRGRQLGITTKRPVKRSDIDKSLYGCQ
jgi:hypothetical protein